MTTDLTKSVRTRSGLDVRILCTDAPDEAYPTAGYIIDEYGDVVMMMWTASGAYDIDQPSHNYDLVNVPETTKRYVCTDAYSGCGSLGEVKYYQNRPQDVLELTYEGDKLTAVKIVED